MFEMVLYPTPNLSTTTMDLVRCLIMKKVDRALIVGSVERGIKVRGTQNKVWPHNRKNPS
jgi:hypothetical protein